MTWVDWLILIISQAVVIRTAWRILVKDAITALGCLEKMFCFLLCLGLSALDILILVGRVRSGSPVHVITSVELIGLALIASLLNDIGYLATRSPDMPAFPIPGYTPYTREKVMITNRTIGIILISIVEGWLLFGGPLEPLRQILIG